MSVYSRRGLGQADPVTTALVAVNVAIFAGLLATGANASPLLPRLALMPLGRCVPDSDPGSYFPQLGEAACLAEASTSAVSWLPGVSDGAAWQLLTSAFTHVQPLHVGFNMLALWFLGPPLEQVLGRLRFLALYLVSSLTGSALVYWLAPPASLTLGASGAIFGLMGAVLVIALKRRGDVRSILVWIGLNALITIVGGSYISWQGHLGGFLGGLAVAGLFAYTPYRKRHLVGVALAGLTVALLVGVAIRTVMLRSTF